jgi:hypothetical protein
MANDKAQKENGVKSTEKKKGKTQNYRTVI